MSVLKSKRSRACMLWVCRILLNINLITLWRAWEHNNYEVMILCGVHIVVMVILDGEFNDDN